MRGHGAAAHRLARRHHHGRLYAVPQRGSFSGSTRRHLRSRSIREKRSTCGENFKDLIEKQAVNVDRPRSGRRGRHRGIEVDRGIRRSSRHPGRAPRNLRRADRVGRACPPGGRAAAELHRLRVSGRPAGLVVRHRRRAAEPDHEKGSSRSGTARGWASPSTWRQRKHTWRTRIVTSSIDPSVIGAAALLGLLTLPASAQQASPPVVVQPGAPGQPSKTLPPSTRPTVPQLSPADVAFMQGMIMHHSQAVEMTALIDSHTQNKDVRSLGAKISRSQSDEIRFMQRWLVARGQPVSIAMPGMPDMDMAGNPSNQCPGC